MITLLDLIPTENTTTPTPRVSITEEVIVINFNLTLPELIATLEHNNHSLTDMYRALAAVVETPLSQIEVIKSVGSKGNLQLILVSSNFQVEPRLTVGLLQSSMNRHWVPYYIFIDDVVVSNSEFNLLR